MADTIEIPEDRAATYSQEWIESIFTTAQIVLGAIIDVASYANVELPSRQIVYVNDAPNDCEQVAVSVATAGFGRPGDPMAGPETCWHPMRVTMTAEITRCVPETNKVSAPGRYASGVVNLPEATDMEDHAITVMKDMMILLEAANVASNYPYVGAGSEASVVVTNPQGGMQSVHLSLTVQVG